eukprot:TRINITY_DN33321_c0_g1_i1.p1 TRINITY_DN33321_c0_g1~~TRINITY_DN33321_c0_g1_i1.p1  ORF type:complete len:150 (-),score=14.07 TRINITY_DN33321_c0_g1_i1:19-468(-)
MTEKEVPATKILSIRQTVPSGQVGSTISSLGISLLVFATEQNQKPAAPGFTINHSRTEDSVDIEVCLPVGSEIQVVGHKSIGFREVPGGKCYSTTFKGGYDQLPAAHKTLSETLQSKNLQLAHSREVFLKGPQQTKDTNEWETEVQYFF